MNPEPTPPDRASAPPTIAQLKAQAFQLIDQLAYVPGSAKLLLGVIYQLELFVGYKSHRRVQMAARLKR